MKDLFLSECRRFKNAALIFAGAHLLLQFLLNRFVELLQRSWQVHMLVLCAYMAFSLGFALYQFGSYRQPSRWIWLMHRPMSPSAIFSAVALASAALIAFGVGLPALLTVFITDMLTGRMVDLRHYLLVPELAMLTMSAWLVGSYVILNQRRSAIVILLLPILMALQLSNAWTTLLMTALSLLLLAAIVRAAFKPNRVAPPANAAQLVATALPLHLGFYFVMIWGGSMAYQYGQMLLDIHPLNRAIPPAGAFTENTRAEGKDVLLRALATSADPRAAQWRRQVPLLELANFEPATFQFAVRNQMSNTLDLQFADEQQNIVWTFSHDAMRFHGSDVFTGKSRGWIGLGGVGDATRFPAPPELPFDSYILGPQQLGNFDSSSGKIRQLVQVNAPEVLTRVVKKFGNTEFVTTNERLIAFHADAEGAQGLLKEKYSIPFPGPLSDLDRIDVAPLLDGTLVSFSFGRQMNNGVASVPQTVYLVDAAGKSQVVATRQLAHEFPVLFEHHAWWVSPTLYSVLALPDALIEKGTVLDKGLTRHTNDLLRERPAPAWIAAIVASLLAAALAAMWLRRTATSMPRRIGWIATCLLLGPPSLFCLMVLQPRRPKEAIQTQAALAAA